MENLASEKEKMEGSEVLTTIPELYEEVFRK